MPTSTEFDLGSITDARGLLSGLFEHSPVAFQIYRADGSSLLVNPAFLEFFGSAPPPEYNILRDEQLERRGFLASFRRALAGETVHVPPHWFDPRDLGDVGVREGQRVGVEVTLFPLRDAVGGVQHVAVCIKDVTAELQLRGAAQALARSEELFRSTFEQAAVGVAHVASSGQWLAVNQRLCDIVGYTREELLERTFQEITYAPDLDANLEFMRKMLSAELSTYSMEKRYVRKDGALIWTELTVSLVRGQTSEREYFITVVQDISERKRAQEEERRAERALRDSEARKGAILEAALDCIVTMDDVGLITEFNPAAEKTFGYSRAAALGSPLVELLIPPSLRMQHSAGLAHYHATGTGPILGKRVELQALRADGTEFPVELAVVPGLSNGRPMFTAYIRDITERKQAAEALRASEARFGHLADSGIIGIVISDTVGNIHEANDAFLATAGYSRAELAEGKLRWADMTPPELRHLDEEAIFLLETQGVAPPWEKEYIRKDGTRAPVLVGVAMLEAPRCIAFVLDLSERKKAEQRGASALRTAEQESAHRERAEEALRETEEQLRQSQKMEAIGTLTGSIAHDFNNILSVILSYADLALDGLQAADPVRADVEQIAQAGKRAGDLTRQLLAFSRQQVLQPKIVNLNDAISAMTKLLRRLIGEDIELVVLPAPSLGSVFVDPGQIEQVLLNLVVNARDAMPRGGKLTIETAELELGLSHGSEHPGVAPGRYAMLSVSDTGAGMDRATQARIFEPFFTTKEQGKGTGLGLSTVFGIVTQSGGTVCVNSEPEQGTTFNVYLPRANGLAASSPPAIARPTLRGSETLLLVEDDEQIRKVAQTILRKNGYHVLEAATGADALLICEQYEKEIHLLLTDVVMPRMSGRQLWERLAPLRPSTKVLFMSGYTDDAILHHGVLSSGVGFIQKPLTPAALLLKVREVLAGSRG